MQFVATVGITFQMCILVTGQFGKSISYNKFLVLKVVCIYFLLNRTELNRVTLPGWQFASAGGSRRVLGLFISHRKTLAARVYDLSTLFFIF